MECNPSASAGLDDKGDKVDLFNWGDLWWLLIMCWKGLLPKKNEALGEHVYYAF